MNSSRVLRKGGTFKIAFRSWHNLGAKILQFLSKKNKIREQTLMNIENPKQNNYKSNSAMNKRIIFHDQILF